MRCHYCPRQASTRDHIVPLSRGGVDREGNIVMACYRCNQAKGGGWPACSCERCAAAVKWHWAMIAEVREWSPDWAEKLELRARYGATPPPMTRTLVEALVMPPVGDVSAPDRGASADL